MKEDATEARLIVPATFDRARRTVDQCLPLLESAGVVLSKDVRQTVQQVVNEGRGTPRHAPSSPQAVAATATAPAEPPTHGIDGWIEWFVGQWADAETQADALANVQADAPTDAQGSVNFYEQSAFTVVSAGQVIGKVHSPTEGEPGRDATGAPIKARDGLPVEVHFDDSIKRLDDGQLVAQISGVLLRDRQPITIHALLDIEEDVDFSTGNIDFDGDVRVKGSVRGRFQIRSTSNIEVQGLIEDATVEAGGDLNARGGFAGREHASVQVGGNLHTRYLNNIHGTVQGMLVAERELMNCNLNVHGKLNVLRGAIIGGRTHATDAVNVSMLGSRGGTPTTIALGYLPLLEPLAEQLIQQIEQVHTRQTTVNAQLQLLERHLTSAGANPSPNAVQQQSELQAEQATLDQTRKKAQQALDHLRKTMNQPCNALINVGRLFCPGVTIIIGRHCYHMYKEMRGPLQIRVNANGEAVYQPRGRDSAPLSAITDVVSLDA